MLTARMKRRIKHELTDEKPMVWIGKEGSTARTIAEINRQLDIREMVKIRILKTALEEEKAKTLASQIAEQTKAALIEVRGHTFILYRRRKPRHA